MSLTIVLAVLLGPSPDEMKRGVTVGMALLALTAVSVAVGSGVGTVESLLLLYSARFISWSAVNCSRIHSLLARSAAAVTVELRLLTTSVSWVCTWLKPPHCPPLSPFRDTSSV